MVLKVRRLAKWFSCSRNISYVTSNQLSSFNKIQFIDPSIGYNMLFRLGKSNLRVVAHLVGGERRLLNTWRLAGAVAATGHRRMRQGPLLMLKNWGCLWASMVDAPDGCCPERSSHNVGVHFGCSGETASLPYARPLHKGQQICCHSPKNHDFFLSTDANLSRVTWRLKGSEPSFGKTPIQCDVLDTSRNTFILCI